MPLSVLVFISTFIFYACREVPLETKTAAEIVPGPETENKMLSYEQFLQQVKGWKDQSYFNHLRANGSHRKTSELHFLNNPRPSQRDSVRKLTINGHTTYTIAMEPMSRGTSIFTNLVIDSTADGVNALLLMYVPRQEWVDEYRRNPRRDFYGRVYASPYMDLPGRTANGRTSLQPICTSVMILSQIVEHLCCHNQQPHDGCVCGPGHKYHLEYLYSQVSVCVEADVQPFGGNGTPGGAGEGGGTIPHPGGGYNPCEGNGLRTSTNPCNPPNTPQPEPESPIYTPNAEVSGMLTFAASKGVHFEYGMIPIFNSMSTPVIARISALIEKYGPAVTQNIDAVNLVITGKSITDPEKTILNTLANDVPLWKFAIRLVYTANAFAAQSATAVKYGLCASTCSKCKGNAFKHALFLVYNADTFTFPTAISLAAAHEPNSNDPETQMDKINNAAGAEIYKKFGGIGSPTHWIDRAKSSTDAGEFGMMCIVGTTMVSTKNVQNPCN